MCNTGLNWVSPIGRFQLISFKMQVQRETNAFCVCGGGAGGAGKKEGNTLFTQIFLHNYLQSANSSSNHFENNEFEVCN